MRYLFTIFLTLCLCSSAWAQGWTVFGNQNSLTDGALLCADGVLYSDGSPAGYTNCLYMPTPEEYLNGYAISWPSVTNHPALDPYSRTMLYDLYIATNDSPFVQVQEVAIGPPDQMNTVWVPKDYWFGSGPTPQRVYFTSKASLLDPTNVPTPAWAYWQYSTNCIGCQTVGDNIALGFGGPNNDRGNCIAVDTNGNMFVAGYFTGSCTFGSTNITGYSGTGFGESDIFLLKLNSSGVVQWVKNFGASANGAVGKGVLCDSAGNVTLIATFGGQVGFGGATLNSANGGMVIAKYSTSGTHIWSTNYPGNPSGFTIDTVTGDILMWGTFSGTFDFSGSGVPGATLSSYAGGTDAYLERFSASTGNFMWAKNWNNISSDVIASVLTDNSGNMAVIGWTDGFINFGGADINAPANGTTMFIVKLNSSGAWISQRQVDTVKPYVAVMDSQTNYYIAGQFTTAFNVAGTNITNPNFSDAVPAMYVIKFNSSAVPQWSKTMPSAFPMPVSILADSSNNIYLTGYFVSFVTIDGDYLTSNASYGGYNTFMVKWSSSGVKSWLDWLGDTPNGCGPFGPAALDSSSRLHLTGVYLGYGGSLQAFRTGTLTVTNAGGADIFVVRRGP